MNALIGHSQEKPRAFSTLEKCRLNIMQICCVAAEESNFGVYIIVIFYICIALPISSIIVESYIVQSSTNQDICYWDECMTSEPIGIYRCTDAWTIKKTDPDHI